MLRKLKYKQLDINVNINIKYKNAKNILQRDESFLEKS